MILARSLRSSRSFLSRIADNSKANQTEYQPKPLACLCIRGRRARQERMEPRKSSLEISWNPVDVHLDAFGTFQPTNMQVESFTTVFGARSVLKIRCVVSLPADHSSPLGSMQGRQDYEALPRSSVIRRFRCTLFNAIAHPPLTAFSVSLNTIFRSERLGRSTNILPWKDQLASWAENTGLHVYPGLVTPLGTDEINESVGCLVTSRFVYCLPLLGACVIANDRFTQKTPGFTLLQCHGRIHEPRS